MTYDAIIIGAGHNGLVMGTKLAQAGKKVCILEKNDHIGGLAGEIEFLPSYKTNGVLWDTTNVRPDLLKDLQLEKYGVQKQLASEDVGIYVPQKDKPGFWLYLDKAKTKSQIQELYGEKDAKGWGDFHAFIEKIAPMARSLFSQALPDLSDLSLPSLFQVGMKATQLRMMGKEAMLDLLRVSPMCAADFLSEFFHDDHLKAALCVQGLAGTYMGPWSPGSAANLLRHLCLEAKFLDPNAEGFTSYKIKGGARYFISALEKAFKEKGGEIKLSSPVKELLIEGNKVCGVLLGDGTKMEAKTYVSSIDPKSTFLNLIKPRFVTQKLTERIEHIRCNGTLAQINFALKEPLEFHSISIPDVEQAIIVGGIDDLERSFDPVKYQELPTEPTLEIYIPTLQNKDLAPLSHHIVSVNVSYVPFHLKQGWSEKSKVQLVDTVVEKLSQYTKPFKDHIIGTQVLSPKDLEEKFGLWGGQIHHGEHALDQFISRPTPETSNYKTPFEGLWLCGSGSHPGGGLTGAPGYLAAKKWLSSKH